MPGSKDGGIKARQTNISKYGENYYSKLGLMGAEAYKERQKQGIAKPRGFAKDKELAKTAGTKGGRISRRIKVEE
jgi:general stress protein YciG